MDMDSRKALFFIGLAATNLMGQAALAQPMDNFGETIQISTHLHSYRDQPSWLLIIRDIDHGQVIPYIFDINSVSNSWIAFTYGRNYVITVSEMQFSPSGKTTKNFCNLESLGAIQRSVSMSVHISGKLTPNSGSYSCNVTKFKDSNFDISTQD